MEQETKRELHRRLSRIGWAVLVYMLIAAISSGVMLAVIPGAMTDTNLQLLINEVCSYGLAPLGMWLVLRKLPKQTGGSVRLRPAAYGRAAVFCIGTIYLFSMATGLVTSLIEMATQQETNDLLQDLAAEMPGVTYVLLAGVLAPVLEELVFRKLLLDRLRPFGDRCAIWVSGLAFGLFHMNLYQFFYASALGMVFAGVVLKTGRVRDSMLLHSVTNLTSLLLSSLSGVSDGMSTGVMVAVVVFCGATLYLLWRYYSTYYHRPPAVPATEREVLLALAGAPGIWVSTLVLLGCSVSVIFLV